MSYTRNPAHLATARTLLLVARMKPLHAILDRRRARRVRVYGPPTDVGVSRRCGHRVPRPVGGAGHRRLRVPGQHQLAGGEGGGQAVRLHPRLRRHLPGSEVRHQLGRRQGGRRAARRLSVLPRLGRSDHHRRSVPRQDGHARRRRPAAGARRRGHRRTVGGDHPHAHGAVAGARRAEDGAHAVHLCVARLLAEPRQPQRVALPPVGRQLAGHLPEHADRLVVVADVAEGGQRQRRRHLRRRRSRRVQRHAGAAGGDRRRRALVGRLREPVVAAGVDGDADDRGPDGDGEHHAQEQRHQDVGRQHQARHHAAARSRERVRRQRPGCRRTAPRT